MITLNARFNRRLFIASTVMLVLSLVLSMANMAAVLSAPLRANSVVSNTVGFEGFLAQANGAPIANGAYTLTFRAYDVPIAGTPLWTEQLINVPVTNGLYSVVLGATMPFDANTFNGNRWIGVTVGNGTEVAPRTQISAVPFALNALKAENATRIGGGGTTNMVALFDGPCPEGWTEYTAAQGRVVVGVPANGTLGGTVGPMLADKENRTHKHPHKHITPLSEAYNRAGNSSRGLGIKDVNGFTNWVGSWHPYERFANLGYIEDGDTRQYYTGDVVLTGQDGATADVIPYIQLRYCKLNS